MTRTIESDETELIFKVIIEAEPASRIIRSFIYIIDNSVAVFLQIVRKYIQPNRYYRSVDTMEFSKINLKFIRHCRMLLLVYQTNQTHDTFPQY